MPSNEGAGRAVGRRSAFEILIVGGCYAGLAAAVNLLDLCHGQLCRFAPRSPADAELPPNRKVSVHITIVDERDGYYHLIGSPLSFASKDYAAKAWKKFEDIPALQTPEVSCIQGKVTSVDCLKKVATIKPSGTDTKIERSYDFLLASSGLRRVWPTVPESLTRASYLYETTKHIEQTESATDGVVVIGGGAVGIEMAAELKLVQPERKVTLVHSRSKLLSSEPLSDEFRDTALELLCEAGVEVILNARASLSPPAKDDEQSSKAPIILTLTDGQRIPAGHIINAISKFTPTSEYLPGPALDKEGYVKISSSLNFTSDIPNHRYHFAAGDLASWAGIKRCGAAMHHGHYAAANIYQSMLLELDEKSQATFLELQRDVPPVMGLAVGKKAATYSPTDGVRSGEDVLEYMFGDDLGYKICWNYMRLGESAKFESLR